MREQDLDIFRQTPVERQPNPSTRKLARKIGAAATNFALAASIITPGGEALAETANPCPAVSTTTDELDARVEAALHSIDERSWLNAGEDLQPDEAMAEVLGITIFSDEELQPYYDAIVDSENFPDALEVVNAFSQQHHGIEIALPEEMDRPSLEGYSPAPEDTAISNAVKLLSALSTIPPEVTAELGSDMTIYVAEANDESHGRFYYYFIGGETDMVLDADITTKTVYHEFMHAIDDRLNCLEQDPQFTDQDPDWLTKDVREVLYESGESPPGDIYGDNYALKHEKEEKARLSEELFAGEDIPERHTSSIIAAKIAILLNRLKESYATWLWWQIEYDGSTVESTDENSVSVQ